MATSVCSSTKQLHDVTLGMNGFLEFVGQMESTQILGKFQHVLISKTFVN